MREAVQDMPVSAAMLNRIATVGVDDRLDNVAGLFLSCGQDSIPVLERGAPVGVITRPDVAAGLESSGPLARVREAPMRPAVAVSPAQSLDDVLARLRGVPGAIAVVVDHGTTVGLITAHDLAMYADKLRR
jgi:CBS domain-containing protein